MSFFLRDASLSDIPAISAIYRESVLNGVASYEIDPPSEADMAGRFSSIVASGYPYIAAVDADGALLGYAYASAFRTRPAYRFLVEDSIYLAPEARGRGVGKALLTELIARCTALGFRQMVAVIGGAHPASVALHRALGFAESGTLKGAGYKHGRWLDTALMQLELGDGLRTEPETGRYPDTLYRR
ncbi:MULTISPECIES: GNAT family N-acetyltransferase [unclassified Rhizobium]|uniref:GNAT family N-acetyltransferase n=1 Tax=unclassified Rhizobium TaxID=2613769 RepID=UPI0006FC963A|nr:MULTISPECIES: GNAT family N-acetyltransferase [unclassified Rhizobium]KQV35905.1 GCN5 family acetyltransferase [Rhizobium sp. Root1212]KRD26010.1 GCN5 family acetyltransferase [Rhizobium sp. Root268]